MIPLLIPSFGPACLKIFATLRMKFQYFFRLFLQVCSYNEAVSKGGPKPDLFEIFSSLFPEDRDAEAALLWEIVRSVCRGIPSRGPDPVKVRTSLNTSKAVVSNARSYLVTIKSFSLNPFWSIASTNFMNYMVYEGKSAVELNQFLRLSKFHNYVTLNAICKKKLRTLFR